MLSVCAITKNESHCIARMIQSVRGLATEIIIADTGSTDATMTIARNLGARVVEIPWTDDFAVARNRSLQFATQPWILVLDADEALDPSSVEPIRSLLFEPPRGISLIRYHYTNQLDNFPHPFPLGHPAREDGAIGFYRTSDLRLFPNDKRIRFEGAIHETVEENVAHAGYPHLRTELIIHHYGHLASPARKHEKAAQYAALAQKKIAARDGDWRAHYQYAIELQNLSRHDEAIEAFQNALALCPSYSPTWRQLGISQIALGRHLEALESIGEAMKIQPNDTSSWNALGICFLHIDHLDQAEFCFQTILDCDPGNLTAQRLLTAITTERHST